MLEINQYLDNYAIKYAKEVIQQQRMFRAFEYDLGTNINCIDYEMQGVRSVDLSSIKVKSKRDREHYLIDKMAEKDNLEKKRNSFTKLIKDFDKHLIVLDDIERKIVEYELESLVIEYVGLSKELGIQKEEVKKKEASMLLKLGYRLLYL